MGFILKLLGILIILSSSVYAEDSSHYTKRIYEEIPKSTETKFKEIKIEFRKMNGIEVNEQCFKNKSCKALEALSAKIVETKSSNANVVGKKLIGDPASQLCLEHMGKNIILNDGDRKEYDFCEFGDGSIFNSWQFYYVKFPKKDVVE